MKHPSFGTTALSTLGEFGLIARFRRQASAGKNVVRGIGDDCAVLDTGAKDFLLLTADMLVEGVDFTRDADRRMVGRKAMAISLSDIAACAGVPRFAVACVGLPRRANAQEAMEIFRGMKMIAETYGVDIVGGDLSRSGRTVICVTLTGTVEKRIRLFRDRARPGDAIFVTGTFGGSIRGKHLRFTPRVKEARYLAMNFNVHAMIDASDGLAADLGHILAESRVGAVIGAASIPRSKECSGLNDALYSGEEFELIFTVPAAESRRLESDGRFRKIGTVIAGRGLMIATRDGKTRRIPTKGFDHFK